MKANHFLLTLLSFLLPYLLSATTPPTAADFEKRISETYPINANGTVRLDNRYGEINVVTWDQPRVKVDVLIKANVGSQEEFQQLLNRVDITLSGGSGNLVSATTSITTERKSSWFGLIVEYQSGIKDVKIYYTVSMPATVTLDTKARYCDVTLPNLSGPTLLDVGYGDLVAGRLTGRGEVDVSYGSGRIEELGTGSTVKFRYSDGAVRRAGDLEYDGRYSKVRFGKVGNLTLDVGYEKVSIESAKDVRLDGNYNDLTLERAERVYLDGSYTDFNLGTVTRLLDVQGSYGDVAVKELSAGFEKVTIRVSYSDVQLDVDDGAGYLVELRARYGDITVPRDAFSPRNSNSSNNTDTLTGAKAGTGNGMIVVETNYGDIEIY